MELTIAGSTTCLGAWRLIYSVVDSGEIILISLVLEWLDHKSYEKRFKY